MDPSLENYTSFFTSSRGREEHQTHTAAASRPPPKLPLEPEKMVSDSDSLSSSISSPVDPVQEPQNDLEKASTHHTNRSTRPNGPQRITTAQDWSGPDDPENPLNWALSKKMYHVAMVGSQAFVTTYGSSVISPSVPDISAHFNISTTAAILPLTLYVLGLAFGPMISAPISETFGRRIVYLALFPPSLLFTLGAGFSSSFASLLVCRFFAGALGSGCLAIGAGTNSDIWIPRHRAAASSVFLLAPFLGPAFGPPVGGYVSFYKGWRWTQWTILFAGTGAYLFGTFQSETYKKIILAKRAKKLGLPPPPNPLPPGFARIKFLILVTILRPARMLVTEPIVAYLSIYTAFNFSVLFAFFAAFPLVFQSPYPEIQIYHFTQGESGLVFLAIGLGCFLATLLFILIDRLTYQKKTALRRATGDMSPLPPEERLQSAMVGAFLLPIGLFWFAWTARADIHWISPVLALIPFGMGNLMVFCSVVLYLIDTYGAMGGASAAAANGILRYVAGAVFPLFTVQMYRAMGVQWGTSLLGFVTVALCVLPFVFWKFGEGIRSRSAYTP